MYYDWDDDKVRYSDSEEDLYINPSYRDITILDNTFVNTYLTTSINHDSANIPAFNDLPNSLNDQPNKSKPPKKNIMDKLASCKKFSGYPKDNGSKFIKEFESFATLHELDDAKILAAFHLHLQGPALTWYNGLTSDLDWQTIKELFNAKYVKFNWENPSVVIENQLFNSLKLNPGQEIEDFYCQLVEKADLLSKPEHEVMSKFVDGLPDKLAFYVRASKPKDASDALTLAKTGEAYKYRECENTVAAARNISTSQSEISSLRSQMNQLTDLMNDMKTQKQTDYNVKPPMGYNNFSHNTYPSAPRRNLPCYKCNATGHFKRNCNWNGTGNLSPQNICQLCSQNGHVALQCFIFGQTVQHNDTNMQCQICRQTGHSAKECGQLQKGNSFLLGATQHAPLGDRP
ncbi:CNBP [Mytilus edulis]|uniref:CNBP n=1 Tax=Mytilus edulis TaxID=6550 RepID=A0A8S3UBJ5_MYTED|nr:CNBP [Mytilus edulis]